MTHVELGVDGRIILKWILKQQDDRAWIGLFGSRRDKLAGSCEHIMNIQIPKVRGHSWLTDEMLTSQKGL